MAQIKPEAMDKPVFCRGGPRGLSIDLDHALGSDKISEYIANRGYSIGFVERVTFYDIRRRTATDLYHTIGPEATREIMGHSPESRKWTLSHPSLCATDPY